MLQVKGCISYIPSGLQNRTLDQREKLSMNYFCSGNSWAATESHRLDHQDSLHCQQGTMLQPIVSKDVDTLLKAINFPWNQQPNRNWLVTQLLQLREKEPLRPDRLDLSSAPEHPG